MSKQQKRAERHKANLERVGGQDAHRVLYGTLPAAKHGISMGHLTKAHHHLKLARKAMGKFFSHDAPKYNEKTGRWNRKMRNGMLQEVDSLPTKDADKTKTVPVMTKAGVVKARVDYAKMSSNHTSNPRTK